MGILDSAMQGKPFMPAIQSDPATAKHQGYDPATASASSMAAQKGEVGKDSLVEDRLPALLAKDNPYIQQARAGATQQAHGRGLLNSAIAAGMGQQAAIQSALPIAQQDASNYERQRLENQSAENTARSLNAQMGTQVSLSNAGFENEASRFGADAFNQSEMFNAGETNKFGLQETDHAFKEGIAEMERDMKLDIAALEVDQATKAAFTESNNELMQQYMIQYQNIISNSDLDSDARFAAIQELQARTQNNITLTGALMGVEIGWDFQGTPSWDMSGAGGAGTESTGGAGSDTGTSTGSGTEAGGAGPGTRAGTGTGDQNPNVGISLAKFQENNPQITTGASTRNAPLFYYSEGKQNKNDHKEMLFKPPEKGKVPVPITTADIGFSEPPAVYNDATITTWLNSYESKGWRYQNPELNGQLGGPAVNKNQMTGFELQVIKQTNNPPGIPDW